MVQRDEHRCFSRRDFIRTGTLAAGALAAAPALIATTQPAAAQPRTVPRNRTLTLVWTGSREGRWIDYELWNPYAIGSNHQNGPGILYEPLAYYSAFADKEYLWLAESYKYSPDFKELTIKTRSGIRWSDGTPFSADDVTYTLNSLKELGPKVRWGVDVQQFMQEARTTAPSTVVIKFKVPAPRFFYFMTYKYDIGVYIVPKHVFQGQDWTTFKHFDPAKDWPVTTSPWKVAFTSPQQKVVDRRDEWWAAKAGLAPMPRVERNVWLPSAGEQQLAQALITNQGDYSQGMQPATYPTGFRQKPKIVTHTRPKAAYGRKGWKKDAAGFWGDTQGNRLKLDIIGFGGSGPAIGPVLSELLKRQGVDASFSLPPDFDDRFQKGQYSGALYGHGGSVNDPYHTLRLYQSVSVAVPGGHLVNFPRWKNEAYNKIVDDVFVTDMSNKARLTELFRKAMEIWIPELPDIPLVHNFHRIPMNTTYWTNWPTEQNSYVNGAFWHLTYAMILWNLQPTQ